MTIAIYTLDELTDMLVGYCRDHGIEYASADELLVRFTSKPPEERSPAEIEHAEWLYWFLRHWNITEEAEVVS